MADRVKSTMGGSKPTTPKKKKSKGKKKPFKAMHIRRMTGDENQQFSITHDQHPGADGVTPEPEEHGADDKDALLQHIEQHADNMGPAPAQPPMQV